VVSTSLGRGNIRQNTFTISVSNDGSQFTNVLSGKSSGATSSFETYALPSNTNCRYVRITVTGNTENNWVSIYELRINGYQSST
jgi:F5/8 type C domain